MKYSGIGGQAVIEGIMMMNVKLTATLVCSSLFLSACANNMSTNDMLSLGTSGVQALTLSDSQLRDTANQSCAQMDKANNVAAANSKYTKRLNNIKKGLPTSIDGVPLSFKVYQVRDINAWAMPNGCIRVYAGLMDMMTDDEVRGVLGHEIGHVIARHHEERITRQMGAQAGLGVLGAMAGARYGEGAANTVNQLGGMTAQAAFLLPGSRTQESEADVVGQRLMAQAGFDPRQAVGLWQNMMAASANRPPQWLSTHPDPANRIRELERDAPSLVPTYEAARKAGNVPKCG